MIRVTPRRVALVGTSALGTAAFAASFFVAADLRTVARPMVAVMVAATISWAGFLAVLLASRERRAAAEGWADLLLLTMNAGVLVFTPAALLNFAGAAPPWWVAAALLVLADAVMAAIFVRGARPLGAGLGAALALWFAGLHGSFAAAFPLGWWVGGLVT